MDLTMVTQKTASVTAVNLTPITGASVTVNIQSGALPGGLTLDPADAFAIGDAMKDAARKAGYTPSPAPPAP